MLDNEEDSESAESCIKLELSVQGMMCAACVATVESALMCIDGVLLVRIALLLEKVEVNYDNKVLQAGAQYITSLIEDIGYDASIISEKEINENRKYVAKR